MGDNVISAKENFLETIRLTEEEIGKDSALHKLGADLINTSF